MADRRCSRASVLHLFEKDSGIFFDDDTLHPDDAAGPAENRPGFAGFRVELHALEYLLERPGAAGVAESNAVAGAGRAQEGGAVVHRFGFCAQACPEADAEAGDLAGDRKAEGCGGCGGLRCRAAPQAQLAGSSLSAEFGGELLTSGALWSDDGHEALGLLEVERRAELFGGGAEDAAAQCWSQRAQAFEFDAGFGFAGMRGNGAASTADGAAGKQQGGKQARDFRLPPALLVAGNEGEVGQVFGDAWIEGRERRQQLMADAVSGEGSVCVGGIFAPGLAEAVEPRFNLGASGGEKRPEDKAAGTANNGMNAAQAFGPRAAQQAVEDGFGLVVEGMGGGDGGGPAFAEQGAEPGVA